MRHRLAADRVRVSPTRSDCAGRRAGRTDGADHVHGGGALRCVLPDGSGPTGEYRIGADPGPNLPEHRGGAYAGRAAGLRRLPVPRRALRADRRVSLDLPVALERRGARDVCGQVLQDREREAEHPLCLKREDVTRDLSGRQLGSG